MRRGEQSPSLIFDLSHIDAGDLHVWVSQGPLCLYGDVQIVATWLSNDHLLMLKSLI